MGGARLSIYTIAAAGGIVLCAAALPSAAAEMDCVVLTDGTVLRGVVRSWGDPIRFSPRGAEPEVELDARFVREVRRGQCPPGAEAEEQAAIARALASEPRESPPRSSAAEAAPERPREPEAKAPNPNVELPPSLTGSAPEEATQRHAPAGPPQRWYGAPMLATDGGALALGTLALYASNRSSGVATALGALAGGLYLFGGPTIDGLHVRGGRAVRMALARLGLPAAGALIGGLAGFAGNGNSTRENGTIYDTLGGAGVGFSVGVLAAMLWDNLTAFEPVAEPSRVSLTPVATERTQALALRVSF